MNIIGIVSDNFFDEFVNFFTGDLIGSGVSRQVFEFPLNPLWVLKVEKNKDRFQNITEWKFWNDSNKLPEIQRWLAPCHFISSCGTFLIQSRAYDLRPHEIPKSVPAFLPDHSINNFGTINRRVVCRDYGYIQMKINRKLRPWDDDKAFEVIEKVKRKK